MSAQRAIVIMGVLSMGAWAQSAPSINPGGAINAASSAPGAPLAPGSIPSVYGSFLLTSPSPPPAAPHQPLRTFAAVQRQRTGAALLRLQRPGQPSGAVGDCRTVTDISHCHIQRPDQQPTDRSSGAVRARHL